jgi:hypothetical protein
MAIAGYAVAGSGRRSWPWAGFGPVERGLAYFLLVLALLVTIVTGTLVAGGRSAPSDPRQWFSEREPVGPIIGLPPEKATPSTPDTGELVLRYIGRPQSGPPWRLTQVYADGRLITGVEATAAWRLAGGDDVVEQRLTAMGVDLMRSAVLSATTLDPDLVSEYDSEEKVSSGGGPGNEWGILQARTGGQLFQVGWTDPSLPGRIVDPGAWLPPQAWLNKQAVPYIASRFAVCVDSDEMSPPYPASPTNDSRHAAEAFEQIPENVRGLIRSRAIADVPARADARCLFEVTTDDARGIAAALDEAMAPTGTILEWSLPRPASGGFANVELLRVLPDGSSVCNCG